MKTLNINGVIITETCLGLIHDCQTEGLGKAMFKDMQKISRYLIDSTRGEDDPITNQLVIKLLQALCDIKYIIKGITDTNEEEVDDDE
jgi:hypothetical protein